MSFPALYVCPFVTMRNMNNSCRRYLRHSEAAACPCSPLIIACICTYIIIIWSSIKIPAEPTTRNNDLFISTPRHGGSAEPALHVARRKLRLVREKEKRNSPGIHPCSQLNHCPKGRTSYIRIFVDKTGSHKAQKSQGSGRGPWTQGTKPLCSRGVCFNPLATEN